MAVADGRGGDFGGGGHAFGEEGGVFGVEGEEVFCDGFAFGFVGLEDGAVGEAGFDVVELPGEVQGVVEGGVHALASFGLEKEVSAWTFIFR